MEKYRIKEIVGKGKFIIQSSRQDREKIDNPNRLQKILWDIFGYVNEDRFSWFPLDKKGGFSHIYYPIEFNTLEKAREVLEKLKSSGEIIIHEG